MAYWQPLVRSILRLLARREAEIRQDDAVKLAREECERRGLAWKEPILVKHSQHHYVIRTNTNRIGGNLTIRIDDSSGAIDDFELAPK